MLYRLSKIIKSLCCSFKKTIESIEVGESGMSGVDISMEWFAFCEAVGQRESSNNYAAVNSLGYLGRYQFGMARLCDLGLTKRIDGKSGYSNAAFEFVDWMSKDAFLNSPSLQDKCFEVHVGLHARRIKASYSRYLGKTVGGLEVSLSGAVACFHLLGEGGFKDFIEGRDGVDGYGTRASEYIEAFHGFVIPNNLDAPSQIVWQNYLNPIYQQQIKRSETNV